MIKKVYIKQYSSVHEIATMLHEDIIHVGYSNYRYCNSSRRGFESDSWDLPFVSLLHNESVLEKCVRRLT